MGCPGRKPLFFFLLFVLMYLPGALLQEAGPVRQRKPFFERLRRLEEQFQRFQEAALTHLQGIASNYNLSFDFEARFQSLAHRSQAVALALNQSQATMQEDLGHLKTWMRKTQRRSWKVDSRLLALDTALSERSRQCARERKEQEAQRDALSSLALDVWALQDALAHLMPLVQSQVCNVGPVLVFPNASTKNVVFLCPGFLTSLRALSICSWIRTASGHLGTLLSYATEENDNKLVLHGRDSLVPGSIHFVIGDPAFRELPLQLLLDGRWHHVCVIWTSILGRYWLHVDRRLVATGSRFREGYEIPPRGSLVLGQEQDNVGGGFDSSEAFVGSMAGLAIWDRVLVPGEVSNLAIGKELPMGVILMLTSAISVGRFVQRVNCSCLQLCP
ncbi:Pentraxin-4 [Camelus dromedarius]|uniref:Pentraxin-4 n=1 Tax=Camelus dromedarius TaxID=9838 RepID=A0A5N4BZP4_CAMDR|nr:Pentraxin-4 [Camelus dromedarius]